MRRNLIAWFQPVIRRSGVIASVMQTKRSAQIPVSLVRSLSGFALRLPVRIAHTSHPAGASAATKTSGFTPKRRMRSGMGTMIDRVAEAFPAASLVVLPQIHTVVQRRHLIAVAVEHQRLAHQELADAALGG